MKVTPSQFAKLVPAVVSVFGIAAVIGTASYSWTAITFVLLAATSAVQRIWWSVAVENVPLGAALRSVVSSRPVQLMPGKQTPGVFGSSWFALNCARNGREPPLNLTDAA